jgi:hypothetical protein
MAFDEWATAFDQRVMPLTMGKAGCGIDDP